MNRLMKAEWYRIRHSSGLMRWMITICFLSVAILLLTVEDAGKLSLAEYLGETTECYFFIMYFLAVISAVIVGTAYSNKTAYYEVMAGNKISGILLSKVLVSAVFVTVANSLFQDIYWAMIGMRNGIGEITQLPLRFFLLAVVFFHICSVGVLIAATVQHMAGAVLSYLRFAFFELLIPFCIALSDIFSAETVERINEWFVMVELTEILSYEYRITDHLVFATIFGMLFEVCIWYAIAYVRMKKKLYR